MDILNRSCKNTITSNIAIPDNIKRIFDKEFYINEYPEVKEYQYPPIYHYYLIGIRQNKFPNENEKLKSFNPDFYSNEYPGFKKTKLTPNEHYIQYGKSEGKFINLIDKMRPQASFINRYSSCKIIKNKILFENFNGNGFGCNPKYIALEIIKRKLPFELVWLTKNVKDKFFPKEIRLVDYDSDEALWEYATSKIWISNYRKYPHLRKGLLKRTGQIYIQTWHGSLGIKRLDADVEKFNVNTNKPWLEKSKYESSIWDFLIINSEFEKKILPDALWFDNEMKFFGHARNDIFFQDNTKFIKKVEEFYNINLNLKKIILYVPTFRDDYDLSWHNLDYQKVFYSLSIKFKSDFIFFVRFHPRYKNIRLIPNFNFILDVTDYPDIQELLSITDICITDYSSTIYDYILTRNPGFLYVPDIQKYQKIRGFYYPLSETPFTVSSDNDELILNINNFDLSNYKNKVEYFLKDKGCIEDGCASKRIVDFLVTITDNCH